ncbi:226_t:CDS:10 [Ambispora gerdemannii]|uniref:Mitochondrial import inner membrane translocase subunit TIM50 n=1 Tax=Ambispora gerdemannii TaxID=144530 RepID=A0A9N9BTZ0_9GLOM|nr:226_t:CDS:10 [Ambispora gerdemannii]
MISPLPGRLKSAAFLTLSKRRQFCTNKLSRFSSADSSNHSKNAILNLAQQRECINKLPPLYTLLLPFKNNKRVNIFRVTPLNRCYTIETLKSSESLTTEKVKEGSLTNYLKNPGQIPSDSKFPKKPKAKTKIESSTNPKLKIFLQLLSITFVGGTIALIIYSGRPFEHERENQFTNMHPLLAWYKRLEARTEDFLQFFTEPPSDKLLPDKENILNYPQHTLREHGWRTAKRPGVDTFLAYMRSLFEVVIFTSQPTYIAEPVVAKLDPFQLVPFKLYREATKYVEGKHVKDISKLNRDLSKVIIMDSNPDAYSLQPENAIAVPPWKGDPSDTFLIDIIPFLEHFCLLDIQDVRPVLVQFKGKDIPKAYAQWEKEWKEKRRLEWEEIKQPKKGLASWASFLGGVSGHVQEQYIPQYQLLDHNRKLMRQEFMQNYRTLKEQAPEIQRLMREEQEYFEKQLKESKTTIWQLITQT